MPIINRFSTVQRGAITFTGNTLGLAGNLVNPVPLPPGVPAGAAAVDTIGAFITTNATLQAPGGWPVGTTLNYLQNASDAQLVIPVGSTVLYAELIWSGTAKNTDEDVTAFLNNSINITTPAGIFAVSPDPTTASTFIFAGSGNTTYVRSQNVTALVQAGGAGTYTVAAVPGALGNSTNCIAPFNPPFNVSPQNFLGWTLEVIYENQSLPLRNMNIWVNDTVINNATPPLDIPISGFATPPVGAVSGRLLLCSGEGDAAIVGDQALFGPNVGLLTNVGNPVTTPNPNPGTSPNNPSNNFFGDQINGDDGLLDTTGSFGNSNQDSFTATNFAAARQGWDITNVNVSPELSNNQNNAVIRLSTVGDAYVNIGIGLQISAVEPVFNPVKIVDKAFAQVGDTITYTTAFTNNGTGIANNLVFTDTPPTGSSFVLGTVIVDGTPQPAANPTVGIPIGTVIVGQTVIVVYQAVINALPPTPPSPPQIINDALINYTFEPILGTIVSGSNTSTQAITQVKTAQFNVIKAVDKAFAKVGDTLTYTATVNNIGDADSNNTMFMDPIPNGTSFVANSVTVGGVPQLGADPSIGVNIGTILAGGSTVVTFQVIITTVPITNPIPNTASVTGNFIIDPLGPTVQKTFTSTQVSTQVNTAIINEVKSVDKAISDIGDTLTYTVTLTNTGNVSADNVIFTDPIPNGTAFVPGSVTVNGVPQLGANPAAGVNIGSIAAGAITTVTFEVTVTTIPIPNPIPNIASAAFQYTVEPGQPAVNGNTTSNTVNTQVNNADIVSVKSVDKAFANVGDIVTYTVTLTNTGNVTANNVIFTDPIPNGTNFVLNSVTINGVPQLGANPAVGVNIGSIVAGATITVIFKVTVTTIPSPNPIPNAASQTFDYVVVPGQSPINGNSITNTVTTKVNNANITAVKSVDKAFANVGDTITYTVLLNNTGNATANNIIFTDSIPAGTSFVPNSMSVNGVPQPGADPSVGVNVGNIAPSAFAIVSFKVIINTIPLPNPIPNTSTVNYEFIVDLQQPPVNANTTTNTVTTQVNNANINVVKAVDKAIADVGDIITYTATLTNTGNVTANNVIFTDLIPAGTSFVVDSVTVGGVPQLGANPAVGVNVGSISSGGSLVVAFKIKVDTIPTPNPIPNTTNVNYQFILDPQQPPVSNSATSNTVNTQINNANIVAVKAVDKQFADVGDTITYTVTLTNTGNVNANSVIFKDPLPTGVSFVVGSVVVNGGPLPAADPTLGINVGVIPAGGTTTVIFKIIVDAVPNPNPIPNTVTADYSYVVDPNQVPKNKITTSNTVTAQVNSANVAAVKAVDKQFANVGDDITYTVTLTNTGNVSADNVVFTDPIPAGTSFVAGSVIVDGVPLPAADPAAGVNIGSIPAGGSSVVIFKVKVDTIPILNPIPNIASADFQYIVDPSQPPVNKNITSNTVNTQVNNANVVAVKEVDKQFANVGDEITYTVTLTNTGNVTANNVIFTDLIPSGTSFIAGSVTVNGIPQLGENPALGFSIGSIPAGGSIVVTFKVKVDTIPTPNPIPNTASAVFQFTVDPNQPPVNENIASNTVDTQVNNATIVAVKAVDKQFANVGDTITYTTILTNDGNIAADNVIFTDPIPSGTSFVPNSVTVNGVPQLGADPSVGVNVGNIAPSAFTVVSFKVIINTIPTPNPIPNSADISYQFIVDSQQPPVNSNTTTNTVTTQVNNANINVVKAVDKAIADVGDIITYTVTLTNTGNISADNVIFTDPIQAGTSFVVDSVTVGGVPQLGANPAVGVNVGSIPSGGSLVVTFKIKVDTIPTPNPIPNTTNVNYQFILDPQQPPVSNSATSNTVNTQINNANIVAVKAVDKQFADVGDTITYTATLTNTGNVSADNVVFTDPLPTGTSFVAGSVVVNGVLQPLADPTLGINVGAIPAGGTTTVVFEIIVDVVPNPNPIPNTVTADYSYVVDPNQAPKNKTTNSNTVTTQVNSANVLAVKAVDKQFANVGDTITYTVTLTNTGSASADNVVFTDPIPAGTSFVAGSVTVDGVPLLAADPAAGVNIGSIPAGGSRVVTFKVKVDTIPTLNPIANTASADFQYTVDPSQPPVNKNITSNTVNTQVNNANIEEVKAVDKEFADVGDEITYTVTLTNTGNVAANNVIFTDPISSGTSFVAGSVTVNGVPSPGANPAAGVNIGSIPAGGSIVVTFKVKVDTIPTPNPILNIASAIFEFTVDPNQPPVIENTTSNTVITQVNNATIVSVKAVDKQFANVGDTITYTATLTNTGNVAANNVIFTDTIPAGTSFVPDSVTVNGVPQPGENPAVGVNVGSILAGASVTVTFEVIINTIPTLNPIPNTASATFQFSVDPNQPPLNGNTTSNIVTTQVNNATVVAVKAVDKQFANVGDTITYTVTLTNTGNVSANNVIFTDQIPVGTSFIPNSVTVNGVPQLGENPAVGVNVGSISSGGSLVVTFKIKVDIIPTPNPIPNAANVDYQFIVDPSQLPVNNSATTNTVITQVNNANILAIKVVDKQFANVGDTIIYTVTLTNTGNVAASNVVFTDLIPLGTSFVPNSVSVNGVPQLGADPSVGVNVGSIAPSAFTIVSFNITINTIPTPNPIPNESNINYQFTVDPQQPPVNGDTISNQVTTQVSNANVIAVKELDKQFADVGDIITYTVTMTNTGNVSADNVIFTDQIPLGTNFVAGSVTVNGLSRPAADPAAGFNIGSISAGVAAVVTFNVEVDTIPVPNPTPNAADVNYQFTVDPQQPPVNKNTTSNTVNTQVNTAIVTAVKAQDKQFVDVGDIITYTVTVNNTGNVAANNVIFTDPIPNGTSFVAGSVTVNGIPQLGANPAAGINIGTIPADGIVVVTFKINVDTIPNPNPIANVANINFEYNIDPSKPPVNKNINSNQVTTQVNNAKIEAVKSVDKQFADVGDIITYTVNLTNTGNITATDVIFIDPIPAGTSFVLDSVTINGVPNPGENPVSGVNVGSIPAGASVTVTFKVTIDVIPVVNPIPNSSIINFEYVVVTGQPPVNKTTNSNQVTTQINNAKIDVVKSVDKEIADVGDIITYTATLTNTGNVTATNVEFTDLIPVGTSFVTGSVTINGAPSPVADPAVGVNIGSISAGGTVTVTFKIKVDTIPTQNPMSNSANVKFEYTVDPGKPPVNKETNSNEVITQVNNAKIDVVKKVDKEFATIGDNLTYTFVLTNTGNVTATGVVFKDTPPNGTTFVANSFAINGSPQFGEDPAVGVIIGSIAPGVSITLSFDVTVDVVPAPNPAENIATVDFEYVVDPLKPAVNKTVESNKVITQVNVAKIEVIKSVNKEEAIVGDTLTYTVTMKNTGNVDASNVVFKDPLSVGTSFVGGSVSINGIPDLASNPDLGIIIGTIASGVTVIISFIVKVESRPTPPVIKNNSVVDFSFIIDPEKPPVEKSTISNEVNTDVEIVKVEVVKSADKTSALVGDIITYTVTIINPGTITAQNVFFKDTMPEGTSYVLGSLTPVVGDPNVGVNLGDILPGESITVSFKVKVEFVPCSLQILNTAIAEFEYQIAGIITEVSITSNTISTDVGPSTFKQLYVNEDLKIPSQKPNAEEILNTIVEIAIIREYPIKTIKAISLEGQKLTGNKLIVEGILKQKIEYIAADETQSVHVAEFNTPFSTFIMLPENFKEGTTIEVEGIVEDIYTKLVDARTIFKNVTFRLIAKLIC